MSIAGAVACGLAGGDDETMASGGVFGFIIPVTIGAVIVLGPKWWGVMRIIWRARGRLETDQESRERGRAKAARQDGGDP